jgi:hypothetical protein
MRTEADGRVTLKIWAKSRKLQVELTAKLIKRDMRKWSMTEAFESAVKKVYESGTKIHIDSTAGSVHQATQRVKPETYERLLKIQAYLMSKHGKVPMTRVIHSVILDSLKRL